MGNIPGAAEIGASVVSKEAVLNKGKVAGATKHARRGKISPSIAGKNSSVGWRETTSGLLVPNSGEMAKDLSGDRKTPIEAIDSQVSSEVDIASKATVSTEATEQTRLDDVKKAIQNLEQEKVAKTKQESEEEKTRFLERSMQFSKDQAGKRGILGAETKVPKNVRANFSKEFDDALDTVIKLSGKDIGDPALRSDPELTRQALDVFYYRRSADLINTDPNILSNMLGTKSFKKIADGIRALAVASEVSISEDEIRLRAIAEMLEKEDRQNPIVEIVKALLAGLISSVTQASHEVTEDDKKR